MEGGHTVVLQQLLDQVDVCEHHTATAVAFELESVKSITVIVYSV